MSPSPHRVLVTGSRNWDRVHEVYRALDGQLATHEHLLLIHGFCSRGADHFAERWYWAARRDGAQVRRKGFHADWSPGSYAGFARNGRMVAYGADVCLAFAAVCIKPGCKWRGKHPSHGTTHCADAAEAAGIPVIWHGTPRHPVLVT